MVLYIRVMTYICSKDNQVVTTAENIYSVKRTGMCLAHAIALKIKLSNDDFFQDFNTGLPADEEQLVKEMYINQKYL